MASLLPLEDAQARLLALTEPLPVEILELANAAGRWLATDVIARRAQPAVDLSAMDGYALRHADLPGPLMIVGESAAGHGFSGTLDPGQAVRIFTGAAVPKGADTVVMQEDCTHDGDRLRISGDIPAAGQHIRLQGNDFAAGSKLVTAGERLTPARLALAIMGGHGTAAVRRRPGIALISTGDELVPPGQPTAFNQIPSSNGPMLKAMLEAEGAMVDDFGVIPDDLAAIRDAMGQASRHDVILTIGGASVGDLDLVKPALDAAGAQLDFIKAAIKPGKPLMAGRLDQAVVLGLPGNPVSAFVTAFLFALPLVRRLMGAAEPLPRAMQLPLGTDLPPVGTRTEFIRAEIRDGQAWPLGNQDSAALATLARADILIRRNARAPAATKGEMVATLRVD